MNINFEYYKLFYIIAKNKNITKGANELNISQPAVSRMLKTLETQIGAKLFIREKRGVSLTNEGSELYNQISESIENIINSEYEFKKLTSNKELKICVSSPILNNYIIPKLDSKKLNCNITFLDTNNFRELNTKILNNTVDCAIISKSSDFQFDEAIKFVDIGKVHGCLISKKEIKETNLQNYKFILQKKNSSFRKYIDIFCLDNSIDLRNNITVDNYESIYPLIESGFGIGFVIEEFITNELTTKKIFKIKNINKMPKIEICIIFKKDKEFSKNIQSILNALMK